MITYILEEAVLQHVSLGEQIDPDDDQVHHKDLVAEVGQQSEHLAREDGAHQGGPVVECLVDDPGEHGHKHEPVAAEVDGLHAILVLEGGLERPIQRREHGQRTQQRQHCPQQVAHKLEEED